MTKALDPSKLMMPDGTSLHDRMQAFADALVAHGQRGVFLMIDMETGRFHLSGHLPDTDDKVVKILEDLIERLNSDLAATGIPTHRIGMRQ